MSAWTKTNRTTIDQRGEVLPPTWCPRPADARLAPVASAGMFRSDPSRRLAFALVAAIDAARETVVAASFLLADDEVEKALLRAARRNVRVYLLLATETRLDKEPREDSEFEQRALADHKKMLETLAGWALIRSAPTYHAKIVLVDPERGGPGFLLTANLTREALTRNEELAVELTAAESKAVLAHLAWAMWEAAEHELLEPGRLSVVAGSLNRVPKEGEGEEGVGGLQAKGTLHDAAMELVGAAKQQIVVASFGWDADHAIVAALCARAREGVSVTVLARIRPAAMPALVALAEAGARVFGYPWLHAKAIAIDDGAALVMSGNLQRHGLDDGIELGVLLEGARASALRAILGAWVGGAPSQLQMAPRLEQVRGEAQVWKDKALVPITVVPTDTVTLDAAIAASAEKLEADPPAQRRRFGLPHPAHQVALVWEVAAPRLAPKAKEIDAKLGKAARPGDPPVFRESSGRIVVAVRSGDELARARQIAEHVGAAAIVVREAAA